MHMLKDEGRTNNLKGSKKKKKVMMATRMVDGLSEGVQRVFVRS